MNYKTLQILLLLFFINTGCARFHYKFIKGQWQAVEVLEEGETLHVQTEYVKLDFNDKGYYLYSGTLKYQEAGTYYFDSDYLFTTDTLNSASTTKAVEIIKLTRDSLHLKMNDNGRERILKMKKVKE
ncbi:MAG: hypothetical protein GY705_13310 [Bacteroidetes bacterium]|nr:hypothetical protein [Bacteroidota bacterium]